MICVSKPGLILLTPKLTKITKEKITPKVRRVFPKLKTLDPKIILKVIEHKILNPNYIINSMTLLNEDENPHNFAFKNTSFSWKNNSLPINARVDLREEALLSYGSCSFDEPRDGLRNLGWM